MAAILARVSIKTLTVIRSGRRKFFCRSTYIVAFQSRHDSSRKLLEIDGAEGNFKKKQFLSAQGGLLIFHISKMEQQSIQRAFLLAQGEECMKKETFRSRRFFYTKCFLLDISRMKFRKICF